MRTGKVKFYNRKNRFGFIIDDETNKEHYVYEKNIEGEIDADDLVQFELKPAKRGEECILVKKI